MKEEISLEERKHLIGFLKERELRTGKDLGKIERFWNSDGKLRERYKKRK